MITFIHTADIHFGMENYGKIDAATGIHTRLLDFARALNFCIDVAIERKVDFFLFCGDAYKTPHPTQTQQKLLLQCFLRLYKAGIPIVIIIGNHDNPLSFGKAHALDLFGEMPIDGFHVFDTAEIRTIQTKSGPVQVVGIPWPTRNTISLQHKHLQKSAQEITRYISQAVVSIIANFAEQLDPTIPAVLAGHLTVSSGIFSGSEKRAVYGTDPIFMPSQLAIAPFDYVALGHLHRYQNLNPHGYPHVVYSGSIERVDFGERKEEKGFCLVKISEKGSCSHEFIPTPSRPFIQIEITLQPDIAQTEQVIMAIEALDITDAVVKIIYHLPKGRRDVVDLQAIQTACATAHYLVGIIPVHHPEARVSRSGACKISMDMPTLLHSFFTGKEELAPKAQDLTSKALELLESEEEKE